MLITQQADLFQTGAYGAFVNVAGRFETESLFKEAAAKALHEDGYTTVEVEEIFHGDLENFGLPRDEIHRINEWFDGGYAVGFGTFHTYPKEGLDA